MKRFLLITITILITVTTFAVARNPAYLSFILDKPVKKDLSVLPAKTQTKPQQAALPEHVPYMFLFKEAVNLKNTDAWEKFKKDTKLTEQEFTRFEKVAKDCQQQIDILDAQAKSIVDDFHKKYPKGNMPKGQAPPPPPQELSQLQTVRNNTILQHKNRLKSELGLPAVDRLETFVNQKITPNITVN